MSTQSKRMIVDGHSGWQSTGLSVVQNQHLTITPISGARISRTVPGHIEGFYTGIYLTVGQSVRILASGEWFWDPEFSNGPAGADVNVWGLSEENVGYLVEGVPKFGLVGKIGSGGTWFHIGSAAAFNAGASGYLYLAMNDTTGNFDNNTGGVEAEISLLVQDVLFARINGGSPFSAPYFDGPAPASGSLELAISPGNGIDLGIVTSIITEAPPPPVNPDPCLYSSPQSINPIQLDSGTKVLTETDIEVQTPAGALAFVRSYNQSVLNHPDYQFMGLGWSHNHRYQLRVTEQAVSDWLATITMPDGTELVLEGTSEFGSFTAQSGSNATLDYDGGSDEYILTTQNQTTFVYDATVAAPYPLKRRTWPTGEVWTYTHVSGKLTEVDDGYGRQLKFSYIDNSGQVDDEQLWRVGDQDAMGLDGGSPSGRYVEFAYLPEKADGVAVSEAKALLATVTDVLGEDWSFDYFGQTGGQTDVQQLNFLIARQTPSVDITGDDNPDGSIAAEALTYTIDVPNPAIAVNGDMEANSDWAAISGAAPVTQEQSTGQVDDGTYAWFVEADALGEGIESVNWDLRPDRFYVLTARVYPVTGRVKMQIKGTSIADESEEGTEAWETLRLVYRPNGASDQRQVQFVASELSGGGAEFYVDTVEVGLLAAIEQSRGDDLLVTGYTFQADGLNLTNEVVADLATTHVFAHGVYVGAANPVQELAAQTIGDDYRPIAQVDGNGNETALTWAANGKQLSSVIDPFSQTTAFTYDGDDRLTSSLDPEERQTAYFYDAGSRQPSLILVASDTDEIDLNGGMELDSGWASLNSPSTNGQSDAQVDTGSYSRYVVASAASKGIESATWDLVADLTYLALARVYPVSGVVKMQVSGESAFDQVSDGTGEWQTLRAVYTPGGNASGKKLQFVAQGGAAEFYVDSVHVVEIDELLRWQEFRYDGKGRTLVEATIEVSTGVVQQQVTREYYDSGDGEGLLHRIIRKDMEASNDVITTYTYDSAGRVTKTQQNSNFGGCEVSYTVYDAVGNVVAAICNYDPGLNPDPTTAGEAVALYDPDFPDKNQVTVHEYDPLRRRVKTTVNAGADFAQTTLTVYDALNRVIRTIGNYVADVGITHPYTADRSAFDHGSNNNQNLVMDTFYNVRGQVRQQIDVLDIITLYGYDTAGRLVRTIQNASDADYNNDYTGINPDPVLLDYIISEAVDEDLLIANQYDSAGNLVRTVDALGQVSFTVYDALNRVVKTIRAAKDEATISLNSDDTNYDSDHDPRHEDYVPSVDPDRDLIKTTDYDALGRVIRSQRLLENRPDEQWDTTLYGYDPLGRQVRVVRSASVPAYDLAADPDLSDYDLSDEPDEDLLTETIYDELGRVQTTIDPLGIQARFVYDGLGRQVRTISNYVDQGEDPAFWVWDAGDHRWEKSNGTAINHGTRNDQNIISATLNDDDGRVEATQDVLGRVNRNVFDTRGRVIRTVTNYIDQGEDPALWVWDAGDHRWEKSNGTPIGHGSDQDENQLALTIYDAQGRVSQTIDQRYNVTLRLYDVLGRQVKTIINYVEQGDSDPVDWLWSETNERWEDGDDNAIDLGGDNDQNRITATTYDLAGRVIRTRDAAGIETRFEYDALGRRIQTIANYEDGIFSSGQPDEDLISETTYNKGGQVISITDARGTETAFTYDRSGRRLTVTRAANTALSSVDYTCYDKAGRVLRIIQNWIDDESSLDAQDEFGDWLFAPEEHGTENDLNLITLYAYDLASQRIQVTDAAGNVSSISYFKDGQVDGQLDPEAVETRYRYDGLRRRVRVVQGFVDQGEDPALWVWNSGWKQSDTTTAITHGTDNDENIIVDVTYDLAGRIVSQRDPRGNVTAYAYDQLNRRLSLSNPLSQVWETAYADLTSGGTQVTMTYPGITGAADYEVERTFDRLGRLLSLAYGDPSDTPDVKMTYDAVGNRVKVSEYSGADFTDRIRETTFSFDAMRRMDEVEFDTDGDGSGEESVSYAYDAGGLRTRLTLPGDLDIVYDYDERGRLISLTDWDDQETEFGYDLADRHLTTARANQFLSAYQYDTAGRLKRLRHTTPASGGGFPSVGVLDDFNRSNGSIGGNWGWTPLGYSILDNELTIGTGDLIFWNPTTFGSDQEVFVTLVAIDEDGDEIDLILKMQTDDWNDGILEAWYQPGNEVVAIVTYDQSAGWVQHGADIPVTFTAGDQFGARALADGTVEVYKNGALVGSRDVSGWTYYADGGYIGLWMLNAADTVLDDFGGGDVVAGTAPATLAHFEYEVDGRGNRTRALEVLAHPETASDTVIAYDDDGLALTGSWSVVSSFQQSTDTAAVLKLMFLADEATLTMGKGPDHSIYDLYLDGEFWQSVDGYAASPDQEDIVITSAVLLDEGPHTLEIRNQNSKNASSSSYKVRFSQVLVEDKTWTLHTIEYGYDALARLLEARFNPGINAAAADGDLLRRYLYTYDRAGNRLSQSVALNGASPTVTNFTYNAANQLTSGSATYDDNGNLTSDGTNSYTWDRANRLVGWDNGVAADLTAYAYDGLGNRVLQSLGTTSPSITQYLLDLQPGLAVVLAETTGANVVRNVHALRGIYAHKDASGAWEWMVQDGLGSVRGVVDNSVGVLWSGSPAPFGEYFDESGTRQTNYGFTGEQMNGTGLVYLRNRYMSPVLGQFISLDPFEGMVARPMSLNRYLYVEGNVPNAVDPSGLQVDSPTNSCGEPPFGYRCRFCQADVDRLAHVARGEASGMGEYGEVFIATAAAIVLSQINREFKLGQAPYPFSVLNGFGGVYSNVAGDVPTDASDKVYRITEALIAGQCSANCSHPMAVFNGCTRDRALEKYSNYPHLYPEITQRISDLNFIADPLNRTMIYELSFYSDNIDNNLQPVNPFEQLSSRTGIVENVLGQQEAFKGAIFKGSVKSVVITNDFNAVPLEWNCKAASNRVINPSYDPNAVARPEWAANSTCTPNCNKSAWWWGHSDRDTMVRIATLTGSPLGENQRWLRVSNDIYQNEIVDKGIGGAGYVAACS